MYIEGPYGAPRVDLHGTRFKSFVIVTAGMGWSFSRALKRTLVAEARRGRPVTSIRSIQVLAPLSAAAPPAFGKLLQSSVSSAARVLLQK